MRKNLGSKRVEFRPEHIDKITELFNDFNETEDSLIFDNAEFGYSQITIHRPERDEKGKIIYASKGKPKSDSKLKDSENIPLKENIQDFFEKEVLPFAPDAWWNKDETKVGYELNFSKYFYKYQPPRSLSEITADIIAIEKETENLLKEIVE